MLCAQLTSNKLEIELRVLDSQCNLVLTCPAQINIVDSDFYFRRFSQLDFGFELIIASSTSQLGSVAGFVCIAAKLAAC